MFLAPSFEPTGLHYPGGLRDAGRGSMVFNATGFLRSPARRLPSAAKALKLERPTGADWERRWAKAPACEGTLARG